MYLTLPLGVALDLASSFTGNIVSIRTTVTHREEFIHVSFLFYLYCFVYFIYIPVTSLLNISTPLLYYCSLSPVHLFIFTFIINSLLPPSGSILNCTVLYHYTYCDNKTESNLIWYMWSDHIFTVPQRK